MRGLRLQRHHRRNGRGKSLVIDAIEALLDGKLDEEGIRYGADSARIEAVFFISKNPLWPRVRALLEEKGVAVEEDDLVLSCEFRRQGRSVIRINGSAVNKSLLREVGALLVDVHGQSEHLSLFDKRHHPGLPGRLRACAGQARKIRRERHALYALTDELEKLLQAEAERAHRQEILHYQGDEIRRAKLKDGEEEELEQKRRVMASCEKLKALAYEAYQALNGDDGVGPVALSRLNEAVRAVTRWWRWTPPSKRSATRWKRRWPGWKRPPATCAHMKRVWNTTRASWKR